MYSYLMLTLFIFSGLSCYCQVDTTIYYNNQGITCARLNSTWHRNIHFIDAELSIGTATVFYNNGNIKRSKGNYIKDATGIYPYGRFVNYYHNGKTESTGSYDYDFAKRIKGARVGRWMEFYDNALQKCEFNYDSLVNDSYREVVLNAWDSTGIGTLTDGNGYRIYEEISPPQYLQSTVVNIKANYKNGLLEGTLTGSYIDGNKLYCTEQYSAGKLLDGISYDLSGKSYSYSVLSENPKFPGGDAQLMTFLQRNIKYPDYERDNNIQGKVLLRFVVDSNGDVSDIQIIRHVSKGLDEEALRVVKHLPSFKPGIHRGQTVNVYFNLPIVYRLQ